MIDPKILEGIFLFALAFLAPMVLVLMLQHLYDKPGGPR